ncbi:MAG TPA: 50S ribosomal protein L35 [Sphingobacteriaceae bacterium]|nr:50S ribosomal protein L35 [Sphingobacteriaceae bacterium]
MPKMKTHRSAKKRFKRTGSGKWVRRRAFKDHLLTKKPAKRRRRLRKPAVVHPNDAHRLERLLPYA